MRGIETCFEECLESAFLQIYRGKFEIILSVADKDDPAIPVAKRVIEKYPHVDAKLLIGDVYAGPNPKINNLIRSFEQSRYPILWVLDSNTWVPSCTLENSASHFAHNKVQLVHHIPVAHALSTAWWGACLDDVYLGTMHAKMYAIINYLNIAPCVMGKSNLFRKSSLPDGFAPFAKYIAEDHLIATAIWRGRGSHVLALECVRQPIEKVSAQVYFSRRIRWIRVRKYMVVAATIVEPVTECFLHGLIGAASLQNLWGFKLQTLFVLHVVTWCAIDRIQWNALHTWEGNAKPSFANNGRVRSLVKWTTFWLIREFGALPSWLRAMAGNSIEWRSREFRIKSDMTVQLTSDSSLHVSSG